MALDLLQRLQNKNTQPSVNVEDVQSMNFDMSPEEQDMFDSQMAQRPSTGALPQNAYYPGYNSNVAVGGYSGSEIGSTTLFAPNSALVPIGMMDARDAAVQKAALQRAQEVDLFKKGLSANAPTSKLTNINEDLTNKFYSFIGSSWKQALKSAGNDPNKAKYMIENNPSFSAKKKAFYDFAKYGDDLAKTKASIDELRKTGKFIESPRLKQIEEELFNIKGIDDPNFEKFGNLYRTYKMEEEISADLNTLMNNVKMDKASKMGVDPNSPDFIHAWESDEEKYGEDTKKFIKEELMRSREGSDIYTPKVINDMVDKAMSTVIQNEKQTLTKKDKPEGLDIKVPFDPNATDAAVYNINVAQEGGDGTPRTGQVSLYNGTMVPQTMFKQNVIIPTGVKMFDANTGKPLTSTGTEEVKFTQMGNIPMFNKVDGVLTDDQIKEGRVVSGGTREPIDKGQYSYKTVMVGQVPIKNHEGKITDYKTVYLPVDQIKSAITKQDDKGNTVSGMPVKETEDAAKALNEKNTQQSSVPSATKADWIKAGWNDAQIQQAAKAGKIKVI